MDSYILGIDIRIRMESREYGVSKKSVYFVIPRLRSFLKTIKIFLKVTNKARVILDIAMRFFHVDTMFENTSIPTEEEHLQ
jgi:hypothetical protein